MHEGPAPTVWALRWSLMVKLPSRDEHTRRKPPPTVEFRGEGFLGGCAGGRVSSLLSPARPGR